MPDLAQNQWVVPRLLKARGEVQWRLEKHNKRRDSCGMATSSKTRLSTGATPIYPPTDPVKYPPSFVFAFMNEYLTTAPKDGKARMDKRSHAHYHSMPS